MSETKDQEPSSSSLSSYVTYGVLGKNQEYVDWFRYYFDIDMEKSSSSRNDENEIDKQDRHHGHNETNSKQDQDQDTSNNPSETTMTIEDIDKRAFEQFRNMLHLHPTSDDDDHDDDHDHDDDDDDDHDHDHELPTKAASAGSASAAAAAAAAAIAIVGISSKIIEGLKQKQKRQNDDYYPTTTTIAADPNTVSYAVFDSKWNPIRFSPRHTNIDIAILLHAAIDEQQKEKQKQKQKQQEENNLLLEEDTKKKKKKNDDEEVVGDDYSQNNNDNKNHRRRSYLKTTTTTTKSFDNSLSPASSSADNNNNTTTTTTTTNESELYIANLKVSQGILPVVPIRRSSLQQAIVKKSVDILFNKESVKFFACFPLRYSPRTIYRFDFDTKTGTGTGTGTGSETSDKIKTATNNIRNFATNASSKARNSFAQTLRRNLNNDDDDEKKNGSNNKEKEVEDKSSTSPIATATATATATLPSPPQRRPTQTQSQSQEYDGYIALTIDDVPCRFNNIKQSKMKDVLQLLRKYNAKVTFMIISNYAKQKVHENDMISLLNDGHELANHGIADKSMDKLTKVEFANAINECNQTIYNLQSLANVNVNVNAKKEKEKVKWFRAPQARYTKIMEDVLEENNMHNVMCDCYAACPIIEDGNWIGHSLTKQVLRSSGNGNGSIVLLHMPENGFREYCFTALEILLNELCVKRNYKICTVSELQQIALNENNQMQIIMR